MPYAFQIKNSASEDRLERLIEERLKAGADKEKIDARIWDLFGENWAVMFTDLSGFSRNVAKFGIIHFLQVIYESQRILVPSIEEFDGILLKMEGDSMMVIFRSAKKAIECAIDMHKRNKEYNKTRSAEEQILLCVGIGYGKVLRIGDQDVYGTEVNAASKLGEDISNAWEILVTESAMRKAGDLKNVSFEKIDEVPPGANAAYKTIYQI